MVCDIVWHLLGRAEVFGKFSDSHKNRWAKKKRGICSLVLLLLGVCVRPFAVIRHYNNLCVFVDISMAADSIGEIVFYLV